MEAPEGVCIVTGANAGIGTQPKMLIGTMQRSQLLE